MVTIKNFSIKRKRDVFCLELICSSSKLKEKIIALNITPAMAKSIVRELQKAIEKRENEEDVKYIG